MNEKNYATIEASQGLVANGIVLETEFCWAPPMGGKGERYVHRCFGKLPSPDCIPCPLVGEVHREFKECSAQEYANLIRKYFGPQNEKGTIFYIYLTLTDVNYLIDLLIWVTGQRRAIPCPE